MASVPWATCGRSASLLRSQQSRRSPPVERNFFPEASLLNWPRFYVQLAANDASYTTGDIDGAGGGNGQP